MTTGEKSVALDGVSRTKALCGYFSSVLRVGAGFHLELNLPLQPRDIDDMQITRDAIRLHLGDIEFAGPFAQMWFTNYLKASDRPLGRAEL